MKLPITRPSTLLLNRNTLLLAYPADSSKHGWWWICAILCALFFAPEFLQAQTYSSHLPHRSTQPLIVAPYRVRTRTTPSQRIETKVESFLQSSSDRMRYLLTGQPTHRQFDSLSPPTQFGPAGSPLPSMYSPGSPRMNRVGYDPPVTKPAQTVVPRQKQDITSRNFFEIPKRTVSQRLSSVQSRLGTSQRNVVPQFQSVNQRNSARVSHYVPQPVSRPFSSAVAQSSGSVKRTASRVTRSLPNRIEQHKNSNNWVSRRSQSSVQQAAIVPSRRNRKLNAFSRRLPHSESVTRKVQLTQYPQLAESPASSNRGSVNPQVQLLPAPGTFQLPVPLKDPAVHSKYPALLPTREVEAKPDRTPKPSQPYDRDPVLPAPDDTESSTSSSVGMRRITEILPYFDYVPQGSVQRLKPEDYPVDEMIVPHDNQYRMMQPRLFTWEASNLFSNPLYFEDPSLERYGHAYPCYLQSCESIKQFGIQLIGLPYQMVIAPPGSRVYPLGHFRPGDPAPKRHLSVPFNSTAAVTEALFLGSMIAILP